MSRIALLLPPVVVLDSFPLSNATNPRGTEANLQCAHWLQRLGDAGIRVIVPEIVDYEVRRELMRSKKLIGLGRLDGLYENQVEYLELRTSMMRRAAEMWSIARQRGRPTAPDLSLDADMILCAQVESLGKVGAVIATTNVGHLSLFCDAREWHSIK
jgi:hypothetical protein